MEEKTKKPRRTKRGVSPEMKATQKVYTALKPLSAELRTKVIKAVSYLIGADTPTKETEDA